MVGYEYEPPTARRKLDYAYAVTWLALLGLKLGRLIISHSIGIIFTLNSLLIILKINIRFYFTNFISNLSSLFTTIDFKPLNIL